MMSAEQGQAALRREVSLLAENIQASRGEHPADLVLKGGKVVNPFSAGMLPKTLS